MTYWHAGASLSGRRIAFAATTSIALMLGAASASAATVVKWMHVELDPKSVAVWEEIAKEYEAKHPDVDVQLQFLENEAFKAKLPTLLQSNDVPDFFYSWGGGVLEEQSKTGALKDLTDVFDADGGKLRQAYNASAIDGLSFDGKVWAVPYRVSLVSFFYNKELFAKAGVKAEDIKTWDDFSATVKKIKEAGIVPIAGGGGEKWPIHFYWSYLVMRNGGQAVFDAARKGEGEGFMAPAIIKAGEQLAAFGKLEPFQPGYLGSTWPQALGVFGDGKAAIILGFDNTEANQRKNAGDGKGLAPENIGRFAFPIVEGGAGKATDTLGGLNGWALTKNASKEAIDFATFLTSKESEEKMATAGMILPVATGAAGAVKNPLLADSAKQLAASTWHQNFFDQTLGAAVGRVVNDISVEIVSGQMTSEEGAQQIQDAFELR
ncbi:ABC transporter substrate-binding protein [Agrobacterium radiobacter]|jgi:raffinose/stachyose/melibiose transport system substrate-binding protein|uniref:Putative ABC sugar transporter (Substrate binding protein) putative exported protein n=1 Tax=Agrobacterium tumefaciens str. B6 TaxID=1183423 RepID=A0A822V7X6_AGRTU|nr:extracellular solute-binding protein [Agrobacterium tumefaciens]AYM07327.1 raffinose/stachyose/melibiose transport system substrate-binding protein [Agrobacterium tumefaciens]KWT84508.1 ABC transporter substrate-binding protein [Agrobacterium tumefaciens str. B6]MQB24428.1 extracellular solute-binding protein [Agrobacterium tumefaciens]NSZ34050.1 extracellular solute-binding protein [Agrobacterium tumefaciens]NTA06697.1 extracellular solute-binding protein [Agrobacterium tumefaciens]